ncbi:hypothetical protein [Calycomorphotria hydatis]|nr:hypothetical protein [Calycomorphotria hydatis]
MRTQHKGNAPYVSPIRLLENIRNDDNLFLALGDKVESEYREKLTHTLATVVIGEVAERGRLKIIKELVKGNAWKGSRVELDEAGLHEEDRDFVRAAMSTESKILVADDEDFHTPGVKKAIKKKAKVTLLTSEQAVGKFCEPE